MTATGPSDGSSSAPGHVPVMLDRVVALLGPALSAPDAVLVDATLGLAGHAVALLSRFPSVHLIGIDRDGDALRRSGDQLAPYISRVSLAHAVYDELPAILADRGVDQVDGVLFDLGVSSVQLDEVERGFSYAHDAPLDMRMDPTEALTAADICNDYDVAELTRILRDYGEERFSRRIAERIVRTRAQQPFTSTSELVDVVRAAIPAAARRHGGHPAKRTFQALRIAVNRELAALESALPAAIDALRIGGRVVVLAYQSLEDRIVKRTFVSRARPSVPLDLPVPPPEPTLRLLTKGAEKASADEAADNPRASSVRLRAAERIAA
ncbi:MAG: 16S rRNA (cytosine(1402)-N(4))-methyltransferase RsmH [Actinomycetes bacterium]